MERNARSWHLRACLMPGFRIEPPASLSANAAAGRGYAGVLLGDDIAAASAAARLDWSLVCFPIRSFRVFQAQTVDYSYSGYGAKLTILSTQVQSVQLLQTAKPAQQAPSSVRAQYWFNSWTIEREKLWRKATTKGKRKAATKSLALKKTHTLTQTNDVCSRSSWRRNRSMQNS